jgi:Fe-Mn family superoxide dismutase
MTYTLPDLAYDYSALEPAMSGAILELHHDKHHAAYVNGANSTLEKLADARSSGEFPTINQLSKDLAFHLSGHVLHSMFWTNLSPDGGGEPQGELAQAIDNDFGSFDALRSQMQAATVGVQGSGWGALAWEPADGRLVVHQIYDHQSNMGQGTEPLLVIDAWEHAYYLQYKNDRAGFVTAIWSVVNWDDVASRFAAARG